MQKNSLILLIALIGMLILSNKAIACNKHDNKKVRTQLVIQKQKATNGVNCCNSHSKGFDHECDKNCNHHNCACNTISQVVFFNSNEVNLTSFFTSLVGGKYNMYKPSFYNDVHISIWHPPKIA